MTNLTNSGTLRTSNLSVLSDRSGRIVPHPKDWWNNSRICARSRFWLTEKLGRMSQPRACRLLRLNVMQKHPSPSAYPERYDPRSMQTDPPGQDTGVLWRLWIWPSRPGDATSGFPSRSRYGANGFRRSFPRYYPRHNPLGFHRYEPVCFTGLLP